MSDTAPQVQVVATEEDAGGEELLADAAVASAALSGAAAAKADSAETDAAVAGAKADAAQATAAAVAATAVSEDRVKQLIDEGISKSNAELAAALAKVQAPPPEPVAEVVVEAPKPDDPPASLKPKRKRTLRERYLGIEPSE